ncbi:hypothetical protein B0T22DRAFT_521558 [Podospora appendiculata]|uniref:Uncharacterized protein n=1 Tax=Podospora appendiculata TaxID=314037 RepID=A0AAE0X0I5_9PEZI|nr:hypothetical protein B0T22DRAFT_521558 [Podospora appendiculata]
MWLGREDRRAAPAQSTSASRWQKYMRSTLQGLAKVKWMLFNIAAPEWSLGKAWSDYRSVSSCEEEFKAWAEKDNVKWTRTHTHFANLGGFAVRFLTSPVFDNLTVLRGDLWVLDGLQVLLARKLGIIASLPDGDIVVKLIALGQILWYVIQLFTRLARRIDTSQLEILTLAYTASTRITYLLLLDKPKDVQHSIAIPAARYGQPEDITRIALYGPTQIFSVNRGVWLPNNALNLNLGIGVSTAVFGLVHCVAWEFTFPSTPEKTLWHASSLITVRAAPAAYMTMVMFHLVPLAARSLGAKGKPRQLRFFSNAQNIFNVITLSVLGAVFLAARAFIIVEVLRSLGFQPPRTFAATWSSNLPHIG